MQFIDFPESNKPLGPPADMTAAECGTLQVFTDGTTCVSRWQPSPEELAELNAGGSIWLGVRSGSSQPAVYLTAYKPDFAALQAQAAAEIDEALQGFAKRLPSPAEAGGRPWTGRELAKFWPDLRVWGSQAELAPDQLYYVSSPEYQAQHLEALREAFRTGGQPAVVAYLKPYREFLHSPETQPVF